jgi:hypothetical protein
MRSEAQEEKLFGKVLELTSLVKNEWLLHQQTFLIFEQKMLFC